MLKELNCLGLACPAPVIQVKELLEKGRPETVAVRVDNEAARENVSRFLAHHHFQVSVENDGNNFLVTGTSQAGVCAVMPETELAGMAVGSKKILLMIGSDRLGHGDDGLGAGLLINFLKTLKEMGPDLWRLVFVNSGVKLTAEGSPAVLILQELASNGVAILVCGTCLNHFQLLEKKQVGETTNMLDIVTSIQLADSVINI